MNRFFKHILTDYDNTTYDTGRTLAFLTLVVALGLAIFDVVVQANHFDAQSFLVGAGGFLGGLGVYLFGDGKGKQAQPGSDGNETTTPIA